jgi:5'-3' exoribonuclease 2
MITGPHGLPPRPNFPATADSIGLGVAPTPESVKQTPTAVQALAGSNRDVVANRAAIRMANMSAAEMLKAEMAGAIPLGRSKNAKPAPPPPAAPAPVVEAPPSETTATTTADSQSAEDDDIPGLRPVPSPTVEHPVPDQSMEDASMDGGSNGT